MRAHQKARDETVLSGSAAWSPWMDRCLVKAACEQLGSRKASTAQLSQPGKYTADVEFNVPPISDRYLQRKYAVTHSTTLQMSLIARLHPLLQLEIPVEPLGGHAASMVPGKNWTSESMDQTCVRCLTFAGARSETSLDRGVRGARGATRSSSKLCDLPAPPHNGYPPTGDQQIAWASLE